MVVIKVIGIEDQEIMVQKDKDIGNMKLIYIQSTDKRELIIPMGKNGITGKSHDELVNQANSYLKWFWKQSYNIGTIPVVKELIVFPFDYGTIITLGLTLSTSV
jgi:hypothetical protein